LFGIYYYYTVFAEFVEQLVGGISIVKIFYLVSNVNQVAFYTNLRIVCYITRTEQIVIC
jgi:hypothetical protein